MSKNGDPEQKRQIAREARRHGKLPSEVDGTTGAPKQRKHLGHDVDHETKLDARHAHQSPGKARGKTAPPNH
jgi:hypothetical protein